MRSKGTVKQIRTPKITIRLDSGEIVEIRTSWLLPEVPLEEGEIIELEMDWDAKKPLRHNRAYIYRTKEARVVCGEVMMISTFNRIVAHPDGQASILSQEELDAAQEMLTAEMMAVFKIDGERGGFRVLGLEPALSVMQLFIDPGDATVEQISEVLSALNQLHIAAGGLGFTFDVDGEVLVLKGQPA